MTLKISPLYETLCDSVQRCLKSNEIPFNEQKSVSNTAQHTIFITKHVKYSPAHIVIHHNGTIQYQGKDTLLKEFIHDVVSNGFRLEDFPKRFPSSCPNLEDLHKVVNHGTTQWEIFEFLSNFESKDEIFEKFFKLNDGSSSLSNKSSELSMNLKLEDNKEPSSLKVKEQSPPLSSISGSSKMDEIRASGGSGSSKMNEIRAFLNKYESQLDHSYKALIRESIRLFEANALIPSTVLLCTIAEKFIFDLSQSFLKTERGKKVADSIPNLPNREPYDLIRAILKNEFPIEFIKVDKVYKRSKEFLNDIIQNDYMPDLNDCDALISTFSIGFVSVKKVIEILESSLPKCEMCGREMST